MTDIVTPIDQAAVRSIPDSEHAEEALRKLREASAATLHQTHEWLSEAIADAADVDREATLRRMRGLVRGELLRRLGGAS